MKIQPQLFDCKFTTFQILFRDFRYSHKNNLIIRYSKGKEQYYITYDPKIENIIHIKIIGDNWKPLRHLKLPDGFMSFIKADRVWKELLNATI